MDLLDLVIGVDADRLEGVLQIAVVDLALDSLRGCILPAASCPPPTSPRFARHGGLRPHPRTSWIMRARIDHPGTALDADDVGGELGSRLGEARVQQRHRQALFHDVAIAA